MPTFVTLGQKSDYSVFVVAGVDEDGFIYIVDVIRDRLESPEIVETILVLNKKYQPQYFFFEKGAITNSILPALIQRMGEDNNYVSYETFARIVDKVQFSQAIKVRMRAKKVKFDKTADWFSDFEDELLGFPRKGHDDQVDGLSILGHGLHKLITAPTVKERMEEEYEESLADSGNLDSGRNEETGY